MSPMSSAPRCHACGALAASTDRVCAGCGAEVLTERCPDCFTLHAREAAHCARCGAALGSVQRLHTIDLRCPRCIDVRLRALAWPGAVAGYDVGECIGCGGLFVAHPVLERATREANARRAVTLRATEEPLPALDTTPSLACPRCSVPMQRSIFARTSGVTIDVCPGDGVWFDHDELPRLLAFVEEHGRPADERRLLPSSPPPSEARSTPEPGSHSDVGSFTRDLVAELLRTLIDPRRWWR